MSGLRVTLLVTIQERLQEIQPEIALIHLLETLLVTS